MTDENPILRWEDPPNNGGNSPGRPRDPHSPTRRIARALMEHPGRWGVIREGDVALIRNTRAKYMSGTYPAFTPCSDFEFVSRTKPDDRYVCVLYGRYVGTFPHDLNNLTFPPELKP